MTARRLRLLKRKAERSSRAVASHAADRNSAEAVTRALPSVAEAHAEHEFRAVLERAKDAPPIFADLMAGPDGDGDWWPGFAVAFALDEMSDEDRFSAVLSGETAARTGWFQ